MPTLIAVDACNTSGAVDRHGVIRSCYGTYGHVLNGQQWVLASGYTGQVPEKPFGGYLLGNGRRLYRPSMMRFVSPDKESPFLRGDLNAYAYCGADPINATDPSGQFWLKRPGYFFRFKLPPNVSGAVETNAVEQALGSLSNIDWRQRLALRKGRSDQAVADFIELDQQKQSLFADLGLLGAAPQQSAERQVFEWRQVEARRELAIKRRKANLKRQRSVGPAVGLADQNERWQRRQLFRQLPGASTSLWRLD